MARILPKHKKFADEYLICDNATQAAKAAGYAEKSAYAQGSKLLKHSKVAEYIQKKRTKVAEKKQIDAEWVVEKAKTVLERCMTPEAVMAWKNGELQQVQDDDGNMVFKFDSNGASNMLKLLSKYTGGFEDKKADSKTNPGQLSWGQAVGNISLQRKDQRPELPLPDVEQIEEAVIVQ